MISQNTKRRAMRLPGAALLAAAFMPVMAPAQTGTDGGTQTAMTVTAALTLLIIVLLFYILFVLDGDLSPIAAALRKAKRFVMPSAEENAPALDEDFDGIRELDNRVPPWFNYLFYGSMVFAAAYMLNFHVLGSSMLSQGEYQEEMAAASLERQIMIANQGTIDETKLAALKDPAALREGMENFKKFCISCHGPAGGGVVGPNLTDRYWIHGGGIRNVYTTIKMGVPAKGMISWQMVLSPKQIQEIASYVLSLQGTNPAGGKPPQGTLWTETDTTSIAAAVAPPNEKRSQ